MANSYYECPHCGDDISVEGRNRREADRKAEWFKSEERVCRTCWKENEEKSTNEITNSLMLPNLEGTPKQVVWAKKIRADFFKNESDLQEYLERARDVFNKNYESNKKKYIDSDDKFMALIYQNHVINKILDSFNLDYYRKITDAVFWIESRDVNVFNSYSAFYYEFRAALGMFIVKKPSQDNVFAEVLSTEYNVDEMLAEAKAFASANFKRIKTEWLVAQAKVKIENADTVEVIADAVKDSVIV